MNQVAETARPVRSADMVTRALGPVMGVEVTGLDLSQPLSKGVFAKLQDLLIEYKVVCFRDQTLTMDQQVAFTELWGPALEHTMDGQVFAGARRLVQFASNAGPDGKPNGKHPDVTAMRWHNRPLVARRPRAGHAALWRRGAERRRRHGLLQHRDGV